MEKFSEQRQRLEMVLMAKGQYSLECDECPLKNQCLPWSAELEARGIEPLDITCEDLLTWYIIHGEFLPNARP
jgi:hypothetical protein